MGVTLNLELYLATQESKVCILVCIETSSQTSGKEKNYYSRNAAKGFDRDSVKLLHH